MQRKFQTEDVEKSEYHILCSLLIPCNAYDI
jgi:hypothetical protein